MPTHERTARFDRDGDALDARHRNRFRRAVSNFVHEMGTGSFRTGLRVKAVQGASAIFEMTWAPDGRATFQYGECRGSGAHIIWRRTGADGILREP